MDELASRSGPETGEVLPYDLGMPTGIGRARHALLRLVTDDNLDLWLLAVAAMAFTVAGIVGLAGQSTLASATLALLALLATSQIRSRRAVTEISQARSSDPTAIFLENFPHELADRRHQASEVLLIGLALSRTVQTYRDHLRRALDRGAHVRIMVLDPDTHDRLFRHRSPEQVRGGRRRIENSLEELVDIRSAILPNRGRLEIRVATFPIHLGINAIETSSSDGLLVLQHYEFEPNEEPRPIVSLTPRNDFWYRHFLEEAERMWAAGDSWPRP